MPRPRSDKTRQIREKLITRLRSGFHPPGQRFFSNRGLAGQFDISYQTADRLIRELVAEGWLERRPSAGTFVSGKSTAQQGAALVFHQRAQRANSFGERLHHLLQTALEEAGIQIATLWAEDGPMDVHTSFLPVVWESPETVSTLAAQRRFAVVLNDTPPPGLASTFVDSIACDDFSGGAVAAEILHGACRGSRFAILAGPQHDKRSRERVAGFKSVCHNGKAVWAKSWEAEAAAEIAAQFRHKRLSGLFCCSDRLAEGIIPSQPDLPIIGFDDAPVAESLNLTTIAIPWQEMVGNAAEIIRRRLDGDAGPSAKRIIAPRPTFRRSHRSREHPVRGTSQPNAVVDGFGRP